MNVAIRVDGLDALLAKERTFGATVAGTVTEHLMSVGQTVADDAANRYLDYSVAGARGVKPKVFVSGLWVVQTLRKSRNLMLRRRNFGDLMMRQAFLPAAQANEARVVTAADLAVREAWEA